MTTREHITNNKNLLIWDESSYYIEFKDLRTECKYLIKDVNGVLNFFIVNSDFPTRAIFEGKDKIIDFLKILNK